MYVQSTLFAERKTLSGKGTEDFNVGQVLAGLEGAAFQSRLPYDKMTSNEEASFPEMTKCGLPTQLVFLNIRNRILQMWIEDPKTQLTYENVVLNIEKPFDSDRLLLRRIHAFLERHGFINFGIFKRLTDIVPSKVPIKVIVIGAKLFQQHRSCQERPTCAFVRVVDVFQCCVQQHIYSPILKQ